MSASSRLKHLYLAYLSKPVGDRPLYRAIRRSRAKSIVEVGVGTARRALRLISAAQAANASAPVVYTGIDLFELRAKDDPCRLPLRDAFRLLKTTGARVRLLPGDPFTALARGANELVGSDLVIVSADQDPSALARAWFYIPRMLHARSSVFLESRAADGTTSLRLLPATEIDELARPHARRAA